MIKAALLFLIPSLALAITPDQIRALDQDAAAKEQQRGRQVGANTASEQMLPPAAAAPTRSSKYADAASASSSSTSSSGRTGTSAAIPSGTPSRSGAGSGVASPDSAAARVGEPARNDAMRTAGYVVNGRKFGITLGTWFKVRLTRNVSNVEAGQVELSLVDDVPGNSRTLPAGTTLFAEKGYNSGTKRLDCRLARGITPSGQEFVVRGSCFDLQRQAGLNGVVAVDQRAVVNKGLQRGAISALRSVASTIPGSGGAVAAGASGAADSMLTDASETSDQVAASPYTIYVSPQDLLVRIDESF